MAKYAASPLNNCARSYVLNSKNGWASPPSLAWLGCIAVQNKRFADCCENSSSS
jgi:hypothetical protein